MGTEADPVDPFLSGKAEMVKMTNNANCRRINTTYGEFIVYPVVGFFDVATHSRLPFACFTLKVIDIGNGEFQSSPNVFVVNSVTKCIEYVCGIGSTVEDSLVSAVNMLMSEVEKQEANKPNQDLDESDFVWLNWQPYVQLTMPPTL